MYKELRGGSVEKENIMPIVIGADDRALLSEFAKKYGKPVIVLDTRFPWLVRLSPSFFCMKLTSDTPDIVMMYIKSLPEGTDRIPLLAASAKFAHIIENWRDELSPICLLWHEKFEF